MTYNPFLNDVSRTVSWSENEFLSRRTNGSHHDERTNEQTAHNKQQHTAPGAAVEEKSPSLLFILLSIPTLHLLSCTMKFVVSAALGTVLWTATSADAFVVAPSRAAATTPTTQLYGFLDDLKGLPSLFKQPSNDDKDDAAAIIEPKYDTVVIDPDFRVAALFLALGAVLDVIPYIQLTLGPLVTLLGALFLFQTFRIRFIFDESNNLELVTTKRLGNDAEFTTSGENVIVGGANRWACDKIVNYDFFPQSWMESPLKLPILVYFKETQTPADSWNEGPGKSANDPEKIAAGTGG